MDKDQDTSLVQDNDCYGKTDKAGKDITDDKPEVSINVDRADVIVELDQVENKSKKGRASEDLKVIDPETKNDL